MRLHNRVPHTPVFLLSFALLGVAAAFPAQATQFFAMKGQVQLQRVQTVSTAVVGMQLEEADVIVVPPEAEALVHFDDGAQMVVRGDSQVSFTRLSLTGPPTQRQKTLRLLKGSMRYLSSKSTPANRVSFESKSVVIGIRGTDIEIAVIDDGLDGNPAGTYLKVNTGQAVLSGPDGTQVALESGQVGFGAESELAARGLNGARRPAVRRADGALLGIFKSGALDNLLR